MVGRYCRSIWTCTDLCGVEGMPIRTNPPRTATIQNNLMKSFALTLVLAAASACISVTAKTPSIAEPSRCNMKPERGPCKAAIPIYFFDHEAQDCKVFYWGGCDGTVPFDSIEACRSECRTESDQSKQYTK